MLLVQSLHVNILLIVVGHDQLYVQDTILVRGSNENQEGKPDMLYVKVHHSGSVQPIIVWLNAVPVVTLYDCVHQDIGALLQAITLTVISTPVLHHDGQHGNTL